MSNLIDIKDTVKKRKSEVENLSFLQRHRKYGNRMYGFDLDFIETNISGDPKVLYELKHGEIATIDLDSQQFKLLRKLADLAKLPAFCVVYYFPGENPINGKMNQFGLTHKFYLIPVNVYALEYMQKPTLLTELQFVGFIHSIKKEEMQPNLNLDSIIDITPTLPLILNRKCFYSECA